MSGCAPVSAPTGPTLSAGPRRMHVITWGCQMNVYDSDRMVEVMAGSGYEAAGLAEAELVVLNTCHIRDRAVEKVFSELGRLRLHKLARREAGLGTVIAVAGCVAQAEGEEIVRRAPFVDVVVGSQCTHRLPALVAEAAAGGGPVVETAFPAENKFALLPDRPAGADRRIAGAPARAGLARHAGLAGSLSAFLTVQEGCDKFCAFCVVPYTRGAESSRPVAAVLREARTLIGRGAREITLLGQNVNAYHGEAADGRAASLAALCRALAALPGLARIRYTTSHPRDMTDELIAAHRELGALMPFLHLPVQSGSDRMLAAMNRRHDRDLYRRVVDRLRAARPDIALSSDFIVGHPGETEADHRDTMALVREIGFAQAYSFKYSPRPGTPAAERDGRVPEAVKDERLAELQDALREQARAFNADMVGRTLEVLVTGPGRHPGQVAGRSPYLQPVHAPGDAAALAGRIVPVAVIASSANSLTGRIRGETGPA